MGVICSFLLGMKNEKSQNETKHYKTFGDLMTPTFGDLMTPPVTPPSPVQLQLEFCGKSSGPIGDHLGRGQGHGPQDHPSGERHDAVGTVSCLSLEPTKHAKHDKPRENTRRMQTNICDKCIQMWCQWLWQAEETSQQIAIAVAALTTSLIFSDSPVQAAE